jgi:hypothetical protein
MSQVSPYPGRLKANPVAEGSRLPMTSDTPPGDYQLEIGFYLWETMARLPATGAAGVPFRDDAVPLGSLSVHSVD